MRIALLVLIGTHGLIHLMGFLKAFGLAEIEAISSPISKGFGILWLVTFVLFLLSTVLFTSKSNYWYLLAIAGVLISQFLIVNYWSDAKFGTLLNLIILAAALIGYSATAFQQKVNAEASQLLGKSSSIPSQMLSEDLTSDLPPIVQKWLLSSGAMGKASIQSVYLEQEAEMRMKPEQKDWSKAKARQYFTVDPPAFHWTVAMKMNPVLPVVGRDKFEDGKGQMIIKLFSILPVVDAKKSEKIDQATLQRYLAEIVWFPSAALSPYISWENIDEYSARATMDYMGTQGSGVFHFDENGVFQKFVATRYKDAADENPSKWTVYATKTETQNGIKIPIEAQAEWELENKNWTWLKLKITHIEYHRKQY